MTDPLILASASTARAEMLRAAGVEIEIVPARIDEEEIRLAFRAEGASARDLADALAELKARKISARLPGALVLGADPDRPDFIWCAAQGGYGFQTAPAASRLLRDLIGGNTPELDRDIIAALSPERLR